MCKEIGTGETLAMKVIKKKDTIENDDCDQVLNENNVLQKTKHPFLMVGHQLSWKLTSCIKLYLNSQVEGQ